MPTRYRTEQYEEYAADEVRTRPRRARKRKKRGGFFLALLVLALAVAAAWRLTDGFSFATARNTPSDNIVLDYTVDTASLASRITEDMYIYELGDDAAERLRASASENPEYSGSISFIADHIGIYPTSALNTVLNSPEKADFVALQPFTAADGSGLDAEISVRAGEIPFLLQYDSRWAFHAYGSSVAGYTACGPTCMSMAVIGLTGDTRYNPAYMCDYSEANGYYMAGTGTSWSLFTEGAEAFGLTGAYEATDESAMRRCLRDGGVLIASMSAGDFTSAGHFIVIYDCSARGFDVYDPSSVARSGEKWTFDELEWQIAQLWCLSA